VGRRRPGPADRNQSVDLLASRRGPSRALGIALRDAWHHVASSPIPENEAERIAVLRRYRVLDTAYEAIFDDIAAAAARICGAPMSAVSLIDTDRQW